MRVLNEKNSVSPSGKVLFGRSYHRAVFHYALCYDIFPLWGNSLVPKLKPGTDYEGRIGFGYFKLNDESAVE